MLLGFFHLLSAVGLGLCALVLPFLVSAAAGSWGRQNLHWDFGAFGTGLVIAVCLAFAVFVGAIGMGLIHGRSWARDVTIFFASIGFLFSLSSFDVWGLLIDGGIVFYLTRPGVVRAFR